MDFKIHINRHTRLAAAGLALSWDGCEDKERWCDPEQSSAAVVAITARSVMV